MILQSALVLIASAKALAPSSPILQLLNITVVIVLRFLIIVASNLAPSSPISLLPMWRFVRLSSGVLFKKLANTRISSLLTFPKGEPKLRILKNLAQRSILCLRFLY